MNKRLETKIAKARKEYQIAARLHWNACKKTVDAGDKVDQAKERLELLLHQIITEIKD